VPGLPPTTANLTELLGGDFLRYIGNTLLMTAALTAGQLVFTTFAAYAFARLRFRGRDVLFWLYVATMMVPGAVTVIPLFLIMRELELVNTWWGLLVPYLLGTPYGIFLMRQFFRGLPAGLEEAARIDGAGPMRFFWDVVLPLSKTSIAALFVIQFIYGWNQYLWPLLITTRDDMQTIVIGIKKMIVTSDALTEWQLVMATAMLAMLPPVLVVIGMQRLFVRGLVETEK
jgi:multiple sugar transport system permease protein